MKKILKQLFVLTLYATFLVPTIVISSSFIFPFIVPKIVIFRSLAAAMVALFVLMFYQNPDQYRLKATPLTIAVLLFVASFTLSTFFGTDAYHSFWDNHERMLGLFTILHYAAYYLVLTSALKTWKDWKWATRMFLLSGTIVTIIGMMQVIYPDLLLNQGSNRVSSTLGNAIYLGGYGLFLLTLSVLLYMREQLVLWKIVYFICGVCAVLAMYDSGTRGSFVGLFAGLVAAAGLIAFVNWKNPKVRNYTFGAAGIVFLLLLVGYLNRQTTFVQNIPMVGRILNSSLGSGTGNTRLIAWEIAVKSWTNHPLIGWGPNNFFYAFNAFYNPSSLRFGFGETWFDNAHNILLNTLTVQGIFGVITYLGIFGAGWWMLFKNKAWREKHPDIFIISASFLAAHLTQNLTVFENPTSYLFFMFWLAFVNAQSVELSAEELNTSGNQALRPNNYKKEEIAPTKNVPVWAVGTMILALGIWVYVFNWEPANANQKTLIALNVLGSDPAAAVPLVQDVLDETSPHIDDIRGDLARSLVTVLNSAGTNIDQTVAKNLIDQIYPALKLNISLHPLDIRNQLTIAQLGQLAYVTTKDPNYIFEGEKYLTQALVSSPRRQQLIYSLAGIKVQMGKTDEALSLLKSTITDDPKIGENYWRLAFLYEYLGRLQDAKDVLNQAHSLNLVFTDQGVSLENQINAAIAASNTKKK